jgi:benzoate transport
MNPSSTTRLVELKTMSRFQWIAIAICVGLNVLDGFDVMVMAFTAPHVSADWHLTGAELGMMLSAGLFGMAAGSLFLAPWADRYGRRAIILCCLVILTIGMLLSAFAQSALQLAALRVLTGVGIGGMLASVGVITAEYSSDRWRNTAIAMQATGYPIGATIGGLIATVLIEWWGWRSVFVFGALASLLTIPLVLRFLPESIDFLLTRRPPNAKQRLDVLLQRMELPPLAALPERTAAEMHAGRQGYAALFAPALRRTSILIAASFFLLMFSFYFVLSWTPKLLVSAGLSAQQGITGGVLLNLGGIIGGSLFGFLATRWALKGLTARSLLLTALAMATFGYLGNNLTLAFPVALVIGAAIFGSMAGLYALAPVVYDASVRTTGLGWAIGIGRVGAILSPMTVGVLIDTGWQTAHLYYLFVVPLLLAMLTVWSIRLGRVPS